MQLHIEICPFKTIKCKLCFLDYLKMEESNHDCLQKLKALNWSQISEIHKNKEEFGIDFDRIDPHCKKGHKMKKYMGDM